MKSMHTCGRYRAFSTRRFGALFSVSLSILLSACATSPSRLYAEQNENALQRQQAEQDRPAIENKRVYLDMIREMQERSLYFASLAHIDAYRNMYGSSAEVQRLYADALRATDQPAAAEAQYRELLSTAEAAAAWHGLGLLAAQRGDYATAVDNFRQAIRREPTDAATLSDLGYALLHSGDLAAARLPLMQAIELTPDNRKIVSNLALYLLLSKEPEKADGLMTQAHFPADVRAEVLRQAAAMNGKATPVAALPTAAPQKNPPEVVQSIVEPDKHIVRLIARHDGTGFMRPMLERFRRTE